MKLKNLLFLAVGCALLNSGSLRAAQYEDNNPALVYLNIFNQSYTGQFDLTGYGYDPLAEQIDSAVATFKLNDALGGREGYTITLEGEQFLSGGSFATSFFGTISLSGGITGTVLGTLDATGILDYTISRTSGEFWLVNADLTAQASPRAGVPDSGMTVTLFGIGLAGLGFLRRKLA